MLWGGLVPGSVDVGCDLLQAISLNVLLSLPLFVGAWAFHEAVVAKPHVALFVIRTLVNNPMGHFPSSWVPTLLLSRFPIPTQACG